MDTTIVTGFSHKGLGEYGDRFLQTFKKYNKPKIPLHVYTGCIDKKIHGCKQFKQEEIEGLDEFLHYWRDDPTISGKHPVDRWNDKERKNGYSYRFDAMKFCKMVYTMWAAAHRLVEEGVFETDYMIWLDGDTVVRKDIPENLAVAALPAGYDFAYLGREPRHTETGFLVFRLPEALPILDSWVDFYESGKFIRQNEWHSAYLFDRARELHPDIHGYNLTPGGKGHVIHKCWVGKIFDHCKGNRKIRGRSPEAK